ncbi:hypothetical protein MBEHAL_1683 [Halarchaeum acidiphilum MH1-52-1]|uniref:Uncharacterized protein n=1 Tax=Halarchaeum acidiphilum MH1-52-1 TaxID=1261545 RepID=U3ADS9_9EURY|nr:hypothetical protein MBEHAL_1683 [Halarchaeum acidiphilum MH1-52-1]
MDERRYAIHDAAFLASGRRSSAAVRGSPSVRRVRRRPRSPLSVTRSRADRPFR